MGDIEMIDLHIHTNCSDGTDTVEELLKKASEKNLEYISITDHDTCQAYKNLKNIHVEKLYRGKLIPGIEIKCFYKKRTIEVLGYKINTEKMQNQIDEFYKGKSREDLQRKYFNLLYDKCSKMGLILTKKEDIEWNPKNDWASLTIYTDLKKYKTNQNKVPEDMWEDFSGFNRKYCANPEHMLYIDKSEDYPSLQQAIEMIKKANGLVFLPHIFKYKWVYDSKSFINEILENYLIDGMECFYTDFTEEQTKYLIDLCNEKNLFKSGGSDYHGKNKEKIQLGIGYGSLKIEKEIIQEWMN